MDLSTRFDRYTIPEPNSGCLLWIGVIDRKRYGYLRVEGKDTKAHRIAWMLAYGSIPAGMNVLHRCDNPPCVNVRHLFLGTHLDNVADCIRKGRRAPNPNRSLSEREVLEIRALPTGETQEAIAARYGVWQGTISKVLRRATWGRI